MNNITTSYYQSLDPQSLPQAEAEVSLEWEVGDVILDLYEITGVLGEGGMGRVYKAHHRGWNIDLAIKCPKPDHFQTEKQKENFIRECETWINLGLHPHIVSCHYVRTLGGIPRVFAEYVEGGSLKDWIDSRRLYEGGKEKALERILDIAIQTAWGLQYAHEQGIVHLDFKPANVMMTPDGTAKVTDFGLAKARAVAGEHTEPGKAGSILLSQGEMTPAYCSPEQAEAVAQAEAGFRMDQRTPVTYKSDIWSWAVTVMEMFIGEVIWNAGQAAKSSLEDFLNFGIDDPEILMIPSVVADLLRNCLEDESTDRPESMEVLVIELENQYFKETEREFSRLQPKSVELRASSLNNRAVSFLDLGKEIEAMEFWEKALSFDPHHLEATFNSSYYRWQKGQTTDDVVINSMEALKQYYGMDLNYLRYLVWLHMERGDIDAILIIRNSGLDLGEELRIALEESTAYGRQKGFLQGATNIVNSLAFSQNGYFVITGGQNIPVPGWSQSRSNLQLWDILNERLIDIFQYMGDIWSIDYSPKGDLILTGELDSTVRIWDARRGLLKKTLTGHDGRVISVGFSPDGRTAISGGVDKTVRIWDVNNGKCIRKLSGFDWPISSVSFSPNGLYFLSVDQNNIRLWDHKSGHQVRAFKSDEVKFDGYACFSPDNKMMLSCDSSSMILWDISTGKEIRRFVGTENNALPNASFSKDGRLILSIELSGQAVRVWEVSTGKAIRTFADPGRGFKSARFSPDGTKIVAGYLMWDRLGIWDIDFSKKFNPIGHPFPVLTRIKSIVELLENEKLADTYLDRARNLLQRNSYSGAYSILRKRQQIEGYRMDDEGQHLLTICCLKAQRVGVKSAWLRSIFRGSTDSVKSVCISPDGSYAITGGWDNIIRIWDINNTHEIQRLMGHTSYVNEVAITPDGQYILSGSSDRTLRIWSTSNWKEYRILHHREGVNSLCCSPNCRFVLSSGYDHMIRLWDIELGEEIHTWFNEEYGDSLSISPDGRSVLSTRGYIGCMDFILWEIKSGKQITKYIGHTDHVGLARFSPNGKLAISGGRDGTLRLWDIKSAKALQVFSGHLVEVNCACFSPDGRFFVSGGYDAIIRIWDCLTGKEVINLKGHTGRVNSIDISFDGRFILSGSEDKTIRLWELDWELEFPEPVSWDEEARSYLINFLFLHTTLTETSPINHKTIRRGITVARTKHYKALWNEEDFHGLLKILGSAGYGWLSPEGVRLQLESMSQNWVLPP